MSARPISPPLFHALPSSPFSPPVHSKSRAAAAAAATGARDDDDDRDDNNTFRIGHHRLPPLVSVDDVKAHLDLLALFDDLEDTVRHPTAADAAQASPHADGDGPCDDHPLPVYEPSSFSPPHSPHSAPHDRDRGPSNAPSAGPSRRPFAHPFDVESSSIATSAATLHDGLDEHQRWSVFLERAHYRFSLFVDDIIESPSTNTLFFTPSPSSPGGASAPVSPSSLSMFPYADPDVSRDDIASRRIIENLLPDQLLPPLDVLLVWHAWLLQPRHAFHDAFRWCNFLWTVPFPLHLVRLLRSPPSETRVHLWTSRTDEPFPPPIVTVPHRHVRPISCPRCKTEIHVPWLTDIPLPGPSSASPVLPTTSAGSAGSDPHPRTHSRSASAPGTSYMSSPLQAALSRLSNLSSHDVSPPLRDDSCAVGHGTGYLQTGFRVKCEGNDCGMEITGDHLAGGRFVSDLQNYLSSGTSPDTRQDYLRGTMIVNPSLGNYDKDMVVRLHLTLLQPIVGGRDFNTAARDFGLRHGYRITAMARHYEDIRLSLEVDDLSGRPLRPDEIRRQNAVLWDGYWQDSNFEADLIGMMKRLSLFRRQIRSLGWSTDHHEALLHRALIRYHHFLDLNLRDKPNYRFPALDIDLCLSTHQLRPSRYRTETLEYVGRYLDCGREIEEGTMADYWRWTSNSWKKHFHQDYEIEQPSSLQRSSSSSGARRLSRSERKSSQVSQSDRAAFLSRNLSRSAGAATGGTDFFDPHINFLFDESSSPSATIATDEVENEQQPTSTSRGFRNLFSSRRRRSSQQSQYSASPPQPRSSLPPITVPSASSSSSPVGIQSPPSGFDALAPATGPSTSSAIVVINAPVLVRERRARERERDGKTHFCAPMSPPSYGIGWGLRPFFEGSANVVDATRIRQGQVLCGLPGQPLDEDKAKVGAAAKAIPTTTTTSVDAGSGGADLSPAARAQSMFS